MPHTIRLVLALHNHQPVGNFDAVIEQAYQDSYLPFLDVLDRYPTLPVAIHTSGSLFEWLVQHRPEYVDRLAKMVSEGRLEVIGGANYEPILTMLPSHDRIGQIKSYTKILQEKLGGQVRGMWIPERVWEPALVSSLAEAGIEYTILDDNHFKHAGLEDGELYGYFITEDQGRLLKVFPGSERLRYLIPFADPWETVRYLGSIAEQTPNTVLVFGDDGEKFGTWPDTKSHVYEYGWLARFFEALLQNQDWIKVTTLAEAIDNTAPVGKVYLPNASYREMVEWSLPAERLVEYEHMTHDQAASPHWPQVQKFLRGGFWRNFKIKYPETDEMYCRMLGVSRRLKALEDRGLDSDQLAQARLELYRGQCNCPYWHGAFGGLYLPHLRAAIYERLISADTILDKLTKSDERWVEVKAEDFNLDARQEVLLANDKLYTLFAPVQGGMLYEFDVRGIKVNLGATITRRPEAYHRKILAGSHGNEGAVASIHDRVVFKQPDLDRKLIYDRYPRKSLIDHFYDNDVTLDALSEGTAMERGDFAGGVYEAVIRRGPQKAQVQLTKVGNAWGHPLTLVKTITLEAGSDLMKVEYELQGLPQDRSFHFAVELNFAGLPDGADDRYFHDGAGNRLGRLGSQLNLHDARSLHLVDEWLGVDVGVSLSRPSGVWTFPIQTVSQSEGGFELVHQSISVQPHWLVQGDAEGKWKATIELQADCSLAESRRPTEPAAANA